MEYMREDTHIASHITQYTQQTQLCHYAWITMLSASSQVNIHSSPIFFSQVGYGDIYCQTSLGKIFIVFYILVAMGIFANAVPELVQIIGNRPK